MNDTPVIVLCGGLGTRLRDTVPDLPKVLAPINGRPFLAYLLHFLLRQGYVRVILATGFKGELVQEFVDSQSPPTMTVECVREPKRLGTGGATAFAYRQTGLDSTFVAMNGDTFFGGSLGELVSFHRSKPLAAASIALAKVDDTSRFGSIKVDDKNVVLEFAEKSRSSGPGWVNAGVYVLEPSVIASIPEATHVSLEREIFPAMAGSALYGLHFPAAPLLDIGTPEAYLSAGSFADIFEKD